MRYCSTRGGQAGLAFEETLLSSYASDGGLYVPEELPSFPVHELRRWAGLPMADVCARVMAPFVDLPLSQLEEISRGAFSTFNGGTEPPLPLRTVGGVHMLETGNGPTLAFKDVGQQIVARLLDVYLRRRGEHATIMVETSGDTGPAAITAASSCASLDIFCLYPSGRISEVQELQMSTCSSPNVHVYRTEGDTDEQARALKLVFSDSRFSAKHRVCSINSINWARVMVQSSYYFWAALQLRPRLDGVVHFVVPTGAFGNACGGYLAKLMGLPIGRIVCATNANDVVHRALSAGDMAQAANVPTISPAMDIQFAYNLERLLYFTSRDPRLCAACMGAAAAGRGGASVPAEPLRRIQQTFASASVSDDETRSCMARVHAESGYTLDPHSAVGVHAASTPAVRAALRSFGADGPVVCVLTAHPAKFTEACDAAGVPRASHPAVDALRALPRRFKWLRARPYPPADKCAAWATILKLEVEAVAARREGARVPASRL